MRVFAAVGTQKFPFDRLIDALDDLSGKPGFEIFVQYGNSKRPNKCPGIAFLSHEEYNGRLANSDVVVVHGGIGTLRVALGARAHVVAIPRLSEYGEHVDDHQIEISKAFADEGYILCCSDVTDLENAIRTAYVTSFPIFSPGRCSIEEEITRLMESDGFSFADVSVKNANTHIEFSSANADKTSNRIIQVGPGESLPGGMLTVINFLRDSHLGQEYGLTVIPTASKRHRVSTFVSGFSQLKRLIEQSKCDCVHIHMSENASVYRTAIMIRWIKKHSCSRVIVHSHGGSVQSFFARCPNGIAKRLVDSLKLADRFVVLTPGWKKWWRLLLPDSKIAVIPNGVNVPDSSVIAENRDGSVLFLGQLGERKGIYCLLDAAYEVVKKHPEASFVFAGNGDIKKCREYAEFLGIQKNCSFVGWADKRQKDALLRRASMLILPSKEESFGIVLLEAMSYALPVICSDGGFMQEVVDDGKDGIVFSSGNSVQLASCICEIFDSPERAVKMGANGRLKVESLYSSSRVLALWEELYEDVLI